MDERKIAVKLLYDIDKNGAYINLALDKTLNTNELQPHQKGFISELVHGVTERKITLDYIISQFSALKLNKISPNVLNVLRTGIYQLMFMTKVPPSAAVNESVKIAKSFGGPRIGGFVNGVLRTVQRNSDNISYPEDPTERLSVYYSYPLELVKLFTDEFGLEFTEAMLIANNTKRPLTLRCNLLKTTPDNLVKNLETEGINAQVYHNGKFPELDYAITVDKIKNIKTLESFIKGEFYVQDVAAMLVTDVLAPKPGDTVIDMCAAPGGKTTHMAEKMLNKGKVYAFDIYEHKLNLINENASRLGITICDTVLQDAAILCSEYINSADCVLVDAPCSGLGIIGRKPDIKYQRKPEDIKNLSEISLSVLNNAAQYVKKGGTLVFSTCTVMKEENEGVIEKFLQTHGENFSLEQIENINTCNNGYVTLYPHVDGVDGFFICKLKKH